MKFENEMRIKNIEVSFPCDHHNWIKMAFNGRCKVIRLYKVQQLTALIFFLKFWLIISWICSHVLLWSNGYSFIVRSKFDLLEIFWFAGQFCVTFFLYDLLFKWKELVILAQTLAECWRNANKRTVRTCKVISLGSFILLVLTAVNDVTSCYFYSFDVWNTLTLDTVNFALAVPATQLFLASLQELFYIFGYFFPVYAVPTAVGCVSLILADDFQRTNNSQREEASRSVILQCSDIASLQKKYTDSYVLLSEANRLLSSSLLLWFLASLSSNCTGIIKMLQKAEDCIGINDYLTDIAYYFFSLFYSALLCFCASGIPDAVQKGYLLVRDVPFPCSSDEHCVFGKLLVLMDHLSSPTGVSAGGVFIIKSNSFISHIGCIITYIVILLQLYPQLMNRMRVVEKNG